MKTFEHFEFGSVRVSRKAGLGIPVSAHENSKNKRELSMVFQADPLKLAKYYK